jgi:hypothetical protein
MTKRAIIDAIIKGDISSQELADLAAAKLKIGESFTLTGRKGWFYKHTKTEAGLEDKNFNPTKDGKEKFYITDTTGSLYGAPMIKQETSLGIPFKITGDVVIDVDKDPEGLLKIGKHDCWARTNPGKSDLRGNIVGALLTDNLHKAITDRFSWSGVVFFENLEFTITEKNELIIDGKSKGFLRLLFLADKNRIEGYIGVFVPQKQKKVKILEVEELLLGQLLK